MKSTNHSSKISSNKYITTTLQSKLDNENTVGGKRNMLSTRNRRTYFKSTECSPTSSKARTKRSVISLETSPEQAASVIKDYILPLFKAKEISKHIKRRNEYSGNSKKVNFKETGILSDFKLVDQLNSKLSFQKDKNLKIDSQLKQANQEREIYHSEYKMLKEKALQTEINLNLIGFSQPQISKNELELQLEISFINEQYSKYKSLYEEENLRYNTFYKLFEEEKIRNADLENKLNQLEHVNTILVMQNDIVGEKLKELYSSINHLLGKNSVYEKLKSEHAFIVEAVKKLETNDSVYSNQLNAVIKEKNKLEALIAELTNTNSTSGDKKEKAIRYLKENNTKLNLELKNTLAIKEKLKKELSDFEKKYEGLQEEYIKLKTKMNSNKTKSFDFNEEKLCANCQKSFMEASNYNWSCRRHATNYSEGIYWCCGQKDKESLGCISSFHISAEEKYEEKSGLKEDNLDTVCFVRYYLVLSRNRTQRH